VRPLLSRPIRVARVCHNTRQTRFAVTVFDTSLDPTILIDVNHDPSLVKLLNRVQSEGRAQSRLRIWRNCRQHRLRVMPDQHCRGIESTSPVVQSGCRGYQQLTIGVYCPRASVPIPWRAVVPRQLFKITDSGCHLKLGHVTISRLNGWYNRQECIGSTLDLLPFGSFLHTCRV